MSVDGRVSQCRGAMNNRPPVKKLTVIQNWFAGFRERQK